MRQQAGFTLIELMVVMIITGIMASWIVTSLPETTSSRNPARLAETANYGLQQAQATQQPLKLKISEGGWCLSRLLHKLDEKGKIVTHWQNEPLHCVQIPETMKLQMLPAFHSTSDNIVFFMPDGAHAPVNVRFLEKGEVKSNIVFTNGMYQVERAK